MKTSEQTKESRKPQIKRRKERTETMSVRGDMEWLCVSELRKSKFSDNKRAEKENKENSVESQCADDGAFKR